jgi:hypothetical protein
MKVEDCIVGVERRGTGGCLDLAFVFAWEFANPLLRLTLVFAVPACALVWLMTSTMTDMLFPSLLIFLFFASLYNGALVGAVGPQVFGVPMSVRGGLRLLRQRIFGYLLLCGCYRFLQVMSGFCFLIPSILVTAHFGHLAEVLILEQSPINKSLSRLSWLGQGGGFGRNVGRAMTLTTFWMLLSAGVFLLIDFLAASLFNVRILSGQLSGNQLSFEDQFAAVTLDNPAFLTAIHVSCWVSYPVVRLAWFFCYLDQRIRNECWDLQLQCRAEAARLEALS